MKVAIFIDNSNVFRCINTMRNSGDKQWPNFYNPLFLADKLANKREVVFIGFYCVPPPPYLTKGDSDDYYRYIKTRRYYTAIEKMQYNRKIFIEVKYGQLKYNRKAKNVQPQEKNVDTQIVADMLVKVAKGEYDIAILVSNDGDYESGVRGVKELGGKTEICFFKGQVSSNLMRLADVKRRARPSYFRRLDF